MMNKKDGGNLIMKKKNEKILVSAIAGMTALQGVSATMMNVCADEVHRKKLMCLNHPKGMELVWIDNLKMPYCILVAGLIALLVFLILNRKKVDLDKLQEE